MTAEHRQRKSNTGNTALRENFRENDVRRFSVGTAHCGSGDIEWRWSRGANMETDGGGQHTSDASEKKRSESESRLDEFKVDRENKVYGRQRGRKRQEPA